MQQHQRAQFKDIAPFLLPWLVPDMRHDRDEATFIYETLSYTLATFTLLQRKHEELARFRNVTTTCRAARSSCFWRAINQELGKIHRLAWQRYARLHEIYGPETRDLRRPARRKILRNHLWTRSEENKFYIFWEQTMIMRGKWRPNFALADMQMIAEDSESMFPITFGSASRSVLRRNEALSFLPIRDTGRFRELSQA